MMFKHAIVRAPGANLAEGLTTAGLGEPGFELATQQHADYCLALEQCGLAVTRLPADVRFPDSTFVEDVAVLAGSCAVLTRPGAPSRQGEVEHIRAVLHPFFATVYAIEPPGTLEGGDICEADGRFFIGISNRTNEEGAKQLAEFLSQQGYACSTVDIRGIPGILHLKSGIAYLGENRLVVWDALREFEAFRGYEMLRVDAREAYAANCVRINQKLLIAAGFPRFAQSVQDLGYEAVPLQMSEFQKMDGGLSCLSLRF